jgi:hypothetical protein
VRRRPVVLAALMVVVLLVFIGLVGAARPIAGLQWLWLLTAFAGLISGAAVGERVSVRLRGTAQPKNQRCSVLCELLRADKRCPLRSRPRRGSAQAVS